MHNPQSITPHRFFCDEMLGRLARYLRAAGYDTLLATGGASDSQILRHATTEARWLLTLDRGIMAHRRAREHAFLLPTGTLDEHAGVLTTRFDLDWVEHSFTRCLVDNSVLGEASAEHWDRIPPESRPAVDSLKVCPVCDRAYWRGSHFRRMHAHLSRWQNPHQA